jgi:hypothetical protein
MTCASKKTRITIYERGFFKQNAIQGHFLSRLKLKMSHACCKSVIRRPEANFGRYMCGHGSKNHQIFQYIKASLPVPLMWASCKVYHIQHRVLIVFPFPTHTHEKLNSFRWEIILNATTWLAITIGLQSRVVIFVCRAFEKALLCANLLNQNLILPDQKSVLHPKYSWQACVLVLVKLLLMSHQVTVSLNFDRFW